MSDNDQKKALSQVESQSTSVGVGQAHMVELRETQEGDVARDFLATHTHGNPITQEEMDRVRRKIDWTLIPMLIMAGQLSGWDKVL
jgi:hypothetical protein